MQKGDCPCLDFWQNNLVPLKYSGCFHVSGVRVAWDTKEHLCVATPQSLGPVNVLVWQRDCADMLRVMRWGDHPALLGLSVITVVLTRDAKAIRVRREYDMMKQQWERWRDLKTWCCWLWIWRLGPWVKECRQLPEPEKARKPPPPPPRASRRNWPCQHLGVAGETDFRVWAPER